MTEQPPFRVLVTGSRTWNDRDTVQAALTAIVYRNLPAVIVHGACPRGADAIASQWALRMGRTLAISEERHPADWRTYGKAAGPRRNEHMVALGADVCLAFLAPCRKPNCHLPRPHASHGASQTASLAEQAGIRTYRFPFDVYGATNPPWPRR